MSETPDSGLTILLGRVRDGDASAKEDLFRKAQARLELLARRMLRKFPSVHRWADTDDVFQSAAIRLSRSLEAVNIADTRGFFNLAAAVMRRELIDLARHYYGPQGIGANHDSVAIEEAPAASEAEPARAAGPAELERWTAFHQAVEELPPTEREVVGLIFYHGWEQEAIATLFNVSARTVRRWWQEACTRLYEKLGGELPGT